MVTTLAMGALAGGAVLWVWGALSWGVLPWHHATFRRFSNEEDLARAILVHCPRSGVYGLPAAAHEPGITREQRDARDRAAAERMRAGPVITAIVQRGGFGSVPAAMLRAFAIYALAAAIVTWLLMQTSGLSYWRQTAFVAAIGATAGSLCRLTDWNWHGYAAPYTLINVADHIVGGFLMGLALAAIV
jgi:hypothetical protein